MFIGKITLENFRVYKNFNTLDLSTGGDKNVSVITGNNGFGKTSLLTSLVWCLYGKLMADVDERYRKEIYESGGYKSYCQKLMNRLAIEEGQHSFSVRIVFKKIFIPAIPCNELEIYRTYNIKTQSEMLSVFIDGQPNELTKEVGPEIFINDFILRKEIAKFFFFDAEKIVELAEIRSIEDRRALGTAYSEVLGIKKYLDLRNDLENFRLRLSKKNAVGADLEKLEKLNKAFSQSVKLMQHQTTLVQEKEEELILKRVASDKFQEQLIREGSSVTVEELKEFQLMKDHLNEDTARLKSKLKELIELVPLAIGSGKLTAIKEQIEIEREQRDKKHNASVLKRKAAALKGAIGQAGLITGERRKEELFGLIDKILIPSGTLGTKALLDFSFEQENRFSAVYDNLQNAFNKHFVNLTTDLKKQQSALGLVTRKLADSESKENDPVIREIRNNKNQLDAEVRRIENDCIEIKAKIISLQNEQNNLSLQISELNKIIKIETLDKAKDEVAIRLIGELDAFILKLKIQKKQSLEEKILRQLKILMHKRNFVTKVKVVIEGDLIDIELYDFNLNQIDKDSLSKGEQQLYATALLKALVEESNIRFPVFIDSPLQKFDREHATNIIRDFYPNVSSQVVLFPLLDKELNELEFGLLYPKVANCYLIEQEEQYASVFISVAPDNLYKTYQKQNLNVYKH